MSSTPKAAIRLRVDPTNPGQFFACCGLLELADRAWRGAEGWFEESLFFFCVAPSGPAGSNAATAETLLEQLRSSRIANTCIAASQITRRVALASKKKLDDAEASEKVALDELWGWARHEPLFLEEPFRLRLDWYLDDHAGGDNLKTWAGQQSVTDIALGLKAAIDSATWEGPETDWLFTRSICEGLPFNFDSDLGGMGSDRDVGFSFDPLKNIHVRTRPLLELLAFVGLQRFRPQRAGRENRYRFSLWNSPLPPAIASAAACGSLGSSDVTAFEFRLLYRTKYLKSFLPAVPRGE